MDRHDMSYEAYTRTPPPQSLSPPPLFSTSPRQLRRTDSRRRDSRAQSQPRPLPPLPEPTPDLADLIPAPLFSGRTRTPPTPSSPPLATNARSGSEHSSVHKEPYQHIPLTRSTSTVSSCSSISNSPSLRSNYSVVSAASSHSSAPSIDSHSLSRPSPSISSIRSSKVRPGSPLRRVLTYAPEPSPSPVSSLYSQDESSDPIKRSSSTLSASRYSGLKYSPSFTDSLSKSVTPPPPSPSPTLSASLSPLRRKLSNGPTPTVSSVPSSKPPTPPPHRVPVPSQTTRKIYPRLGSPLSQITSSASTPPSPSLSSSFSQPTKSIITSVAPSPSTVAPNPTATLVHRPASTQTTKAPISSHTRSPSATSIFSTTSSTSSNGEPTLRRKSRQESLRSLRSQDSDSELQKAIESRTSLYLAGNGFGERPRSPALPAGRAPSSTLRIVTED